VAGDQDIDVPGSLSQPVERHLVGAHLIGAASVEKRDQGIGLVNGVIESRQYAGLTRSRSRSGSLEAEVPSAVKRRARRWRRRRPGLLNRRATPTPLALTAARRPGRPGLGLS
jgi:hypothetical protein